MNPLVIGLVGFHAYLCIIAAWYIFLMVLYQNDLCIPQYVQDFFDKEDGEAALFCLGILLSLVGLGFIGDIFLIGINPYNPMLILFILAAMAFMLAGPFCLVGWWIVVNKNCQSPYSS